MDMAALKVVIGLRDDGTHDHPDFNTLAVVQASGIDWSYWVDRHGDGWKYDHSCGHKEQDAESPLGLWLGMLIVPEEFADQAAAAFPGICERMTEAECQAFYDTRHAVRMTSLKRDEEVLTALDEERSRLVGLSASTAAIDGEIAKARDPDDPSAGVRRNRDKTWAGRKARMGVGFVEPQADRTRISL